LKICLLGTPSLAIGGALQDGEPTLDNFNLLEHLIAILRKHSSDRIRPHTYDYNGGKYSYYLDTLEFVGRCPTVNGPRNIIYCRYTRSAAYVDGRVGPSHGHKFLLCLTDEPICEFFISTDASLHEVTLEGSLLSVGSVMKLDLTKQSHFKVFREGGF